MLYSPQVIAIQTEPEVQYRVVTQEAAKFDWTAFLETTYDDLNDPIGNTLTTANGEPRLKTRKVLGSGGVRQKNLHGGELRIANTIGNENQNSSFFVPNNQGTARLELSYRQPLLDGAGRAYNESEIVLARIQANASEDEVVDALQDHLIKVTEAYWTLYRARAEFLQRQKLFASAREVLATLEGRNQVDTIPRQILRARAAVARSQTGIQRTVARVQDAEAQLRLLVNSPGMLNGGPTELTPVEAPGMVTENADLRSVLHSALVNRPDISEAIRKMRSSGVRLGVSRRELLPRLDFLVESYVADLTGSSNAGRSYRDMYTDNRPGFTVGLEFEIPLGNRAAQAKYEQRQWELKRSVNVFHATVEKSLTDVEIANREVATAYSEMQSRFQAMSAAENETAYLRDRFEVLPMVEDSATLLLEDLLDSFERLADEESGFVQALVDHAVAIVKLKKEIGVLLRSRNSSPTVESAEQKWMADRLDTAVDGRSAGATAEQPLDSVGELRVEANVPRALSPGSFPTNLAKISRPEVPGTDHSGRIPTTQSSSSAPAPRARPRGVGGHTF
ncbi:MAG: TolC family protein [Fuerstiella sp.]|nr:TolC family protein [Fuerstiella sp.]MCP4856479.1 TolC family protein [Fuerstiella sp.]